MSRSRPTFARTYATFVAVALAAAGVIAAVGCSVIVLWSMEIDRGVRSVLAGCGISWLASCCGAIPAALVVASRSAQPANAILASTAIRFLVVLLLVVPLVFIGWFDRVVLLASVAVSYVLMLLLDTAFAVRAIKRLSESEAQK